MSNPAVDADLIVDLTRRLVQTPSVNPMGNPLQAAGDNEEAVANLQAGHAPFSIGTIQGRNDLGIVPDMCQIEVDRRILPGETWAGIRTDLEQVLVDLHAGDPTLDGSLEEPFLGPVPGYVLPDDHPLVRATVRAFRLALGRDPASYVTPFAADGMYLAQAGISTLTFGPGSITSAHSVNESVSLDEVIAAAQVLAILIAVYCGAELWTG